MDGDWYFGVCTGTMGSIALMASLYLLQQAITEPVPMAPFAILVTAGLAVVSASIVGISLDLIGGSA